MSSECGQKQNADVNSPQDEEKDDEILTPQILACPAFQQQIRDIVFTLIPEVPRLKELYLSWESLDLDDKGIVENYGKTVASDLELYQPVLDALRQWDRIQETQGAPGCEPGIVTLTNHPQVESLITNVVYTLESVVAKLQDLDDSCSEQLLPSRLTSSLRSVYEEEKDRGDAGVELISQPTLRSRSLSLDDIPKFLTKKASIYSL